MMQPAEPRHGNDLRVNWSSLHHLSASGSLLAQSKMSSVVVIIADILVHQAFQMPFIEHDHMVKQIAAAGTDPTLGNTILPRAAEVGSLGLDAKALDGIDDFRIEITATIEDQILRRGIVRKCFADLLDDPRTRRMPDHIEVKNAPSIMRNNEEAIEHAKGKRGHGEEVHRHNRLAMVAQKRRPSLCRLGISRSLSHPTQHGSLGNVESEHLQLAMNARRTPSGVLGYHAEDEIAQFFAGWLSAYADTSPRKPFPIQPEPGAMPTDNRFRFDNEKHLLPSGPIPPQHNPEQPLARSKTRLTMPGSQDCKLLPQSKVFQKKFASRPKQIGSQGEQEPQQAGHESVVAERCRRIADGLSDGHNIQARNLFEVPEIDRQHREAEGQRRSANQQIDKRNDHALSCLFAIDLPGQHSGLRSIGIHR